MRTKTLATCRRTDTGLRLDREVAADALKFPVGARAIISGHDEHVVAEVQVVGRRRRWVSEDGYVRDALCFPIDVPDWAYAWGHDRRLEVR